MWHKYILTEPATTDWRRDKSKLLVPYNQCFGQIGFISLRISLI